MAQATKEVIPGKNLDELVGIFGLGDSPAAHSLSIYQTRIWYLWQETKISSKLDYSQSLENVARQAFNLRNSLRTSARDSMSDRVWADFLMSVESNMSWEDMVTYQIKKGLVGDRIFQSIINSSMRSRDSVDSMFKLK
ncbi:hypothetical protein [Paenibacillus qinlingensis]|uniref:Uncharacterized protein n=1 Tax=Paenibacillus qinlingensis TaxID=1837343 RepID=A0ABU1P1Z4_9BACL|nr:hypothetical protein [Paenibacillus qinlingensis]MDR6553768.1 hypothetical protein [Paenibacillus qinlingensis]